MKFKYQKITKTLTSRTGKITKVVKIIGAGGAALTIINHTLGNNLHLFKAVD